MVFQIADLILAKMLNLLFNESPQLLFVFAAIKFFHANAVSSHAVNNCTKLLFADSWNPHTRRLESVIKLQFGLDLCLSGGIETKQVLVSPEI